MRSGVITIDSDGSIIGANDQAADIFGYALSDLIGTKISQIVPALELQAPSVWSPGDHTGAEDGQRFPVETVQAIRRNGTRIQVHLNASTIYGDAGLLTNIIVCEQPVADTPQVELQKEVVDLRARMAALLDAAVDAIIVIDHKGAIQEFNPAAEKIFGYSPDAVVGENVNVLMPEPYRTEHDAYIERYHQTGEAKIIGIGREVVGRRKDGSIFPMELSVGEVKLEGLPYFVGIVRDVTERREFERKLSKSEEQLRAAFVSLPIAKTVCDETGRFLRVNPAACKLWGLTETELLRLRLEEITFEEDRGKLASTLLSLSGGAISQADLSLRFVCPDETIVHGHFFASLITGRSGAREIVVQVVDQTTLVRAESEARVHRERLAHVTRLSTVGEMAAGIAHEINQPLTAIATFAQASKRLLRAPDLDLDDILEALDQIDQQALRAGDVIRKLRSMVRKRDSERETVDVNALIRDIIKLAEFDGRVHDYAVEQRLEPGLPRISVDPVQIQQVVLNLVRNGREAMQSDPKKREGHIIVGSRRSGEDEIEVLVSDEGPGVSEEAEQELFHPFYTTKGSGMGMGLSICLSIVAAHGGRLWFTRNPEQGTTFHFTLPISIGQTA